MKSILALAAVAAVGASAQAVAPGRAHVINSCDYDVFLTEVPAAGGGFEEQSKTLSANGGTWNQQWTELTNSQGWSIKLSKSSSLEQIMQYEYTFHNDGIIWYDLSDVNGNPWDGDWMFTADGDDGCNPKHQAYRYSTDDAYGMQACADTASITVTLCSANSNAGSSSGGNSAPNNAAAPAAAAPAPAAVAPSSSTTTPPPAPTTTQAPSTTLATSVVTPAPVIPEVDPGASVVVVVTTAIVYTTVDAPAPVRRDAHHRHVHHPRHPHGGRS